MQRDDETRFQRLQWLPVLGTLGVARGLV